MSDDAKKTKAQKPAAKSKADFPEFDLADQIAERADSEVPTSSGEEVGGQDGPEPTRYGDWEKAGIATDF
ncbi:MAG: DUF1674 domain-containing protein [Alphaproteobacteria bacterium]|nr:DUF1674 domain-containing protein [Alphaproteobacteria bacterium]